MDFLEQNNPRVSSVLIETPGTDLAWVSIYTFSSYVTQRSKLIVGVCMLINFVTVKWNPNISHHFAKSKLVPMIRRFKNLGVKLQCLNHEGKLGLVLILRNFKTVRF